MPNTYVLISANTLGSTASTVTFSSIPQTYTDLVLKISAKNPDNVYNRLLRYTFNSNTSTVYSYTELNATGTTAPAATSASAQAQGTLGSICGSATTTQTNIYGHLEVYIVNYTSSVSKSFFSTAVAENNDTVNNWLRLEANQSGGTSAVSSIQLFLDSGLLFSTGSSFYLYGIKNS